MASEEAFNARCESTCNETNRAAPLGRFIRNAPLKASSEARARLPVYYRLLLRDRPRRLDPQINQTLVSTGTRALWLAPVDALHGDIGLVSTGDLLIMFSKSGTTKELLTLCPYAKAKGAFLVCLTSSPSRYAGPRQKTWTLTTCLPCELVNAPGKSAMDHVS